MGFFATADSVDSADTVVTADDQLLAYGDREYQYDPSGNLIAEWRGGALFAEYDYDAWGHLRRVEFSSGRWIEYQVDPMGRRIGRETSWGEKQFWLYQDALNPVAEFDGAGRLVARYVYATRAHVPDQVIRFDPATGDEVARFRVVTDTRGSVRQVVDVDTGAIALSLRYADAWGVVENLAGDPALMPFGYAGGMRDDATGHVHFGAREYDPWLGRWISKDPILFAGGDANLYAYVGGDPANFVDPTGLAFYDPLVDWVSGQSVSDSIIGVGDAGLQFVADLAYTGVNGMTPWPARMFIPDEAPDIGSGLRSILGLDDQVDRCSEAYGNGQAGGNAALFVASLAAGGGAGGPRAYSTAFEARLSASSFPGVSRARHYQEANEILLRAMEGSPELASMMRGLGVNLSRTASGLAPRSAPSGWTWHHAIEPGTMHLVPRWQHVSGAFRRLLHPGGRGGWAIWGR